jgi:excisionase family DNA binding protein
MSEREEPKHDTKENAVSTTDTAGPPPSYIRQSQLHRYYPVLSASTWRRLVRDGNLPAHRVGNAVVIATADVERFLTGPQTATA